MAISMMVIARGYPCLARVGRRCAGHRLRQQRRQRREGRQRRHWFRRGPHPTAGARVEHPRRELLNGARCSTIKTAPRKDAARPSHQFMNANQSAEPWVPRIDNRCLAAPNQSKGGIVGLVTSGCTTPAAATRRSTTSHPSTTKKGPSPRPMAQAHNRLRNRVNSSRPPGRRFRPATCTSDAGASSDRRGCCRHLRERG